MDHSLIQSAKTHTKRNRKSEKACIKQIESLINKLPKHKAPDPDGFTAEFYHILKEEIVSTLYHFLQKIKEEKILFRTFYEASVTLIPKSDKNITIAFVSIELKHLTKY